MADQKINRRAAIKKTVNSGAALGALATMPHWVLPALAQGERLVPFTDMPEDYSRPPARQGGTHYLDTRMIDDFYTDNEDFYVCKSSLDSVKKNLHGDFLSCLKKNWIRNNGRLVRVQ